MPLPLPCYYTWHNVVFLQPNTANPQTEGHAPKLILALQYATRSSMYIWSVVWAWLVHSGDELHCQRGWGTSQVLHLLLWEGTNSAPPPTIPFGNVQCSSSPECNSLGVRAQTLIVSGVDDSLSCLRCSFGAFWHTSNEWASRSGLCCDVKSSYIVMRHVFPNSVPGTQH